RIVVVSGGASSATEFVAQMSPAVPADDNVARKRRRSMCMMSFLYLEYSLLLSLQISSHHHRHRQCPVGRTGNLGARPGDRCTDKRCQLALPYECRHLLLPRGPDDVSRNGD